MSRDRLSTALLFVLILLVPVGGCTSGEKDDGAWGELCPEGFEYSKNRCLALAAFGLNTVGYLPGRVKRATIPAEASAFEVRRVDDDSVAFDGSLTGPLFSEDTGRDVWLADFSDFDDEGDYYLTTDGALDESPSFRIGQDAYEPLLDVLMLGMYGQRCGVEVSFEWGGNEYHHEECHTNDASLERAGLPGERDGTLGWHDAGDYGKYTVNSGFTTGLMLLAYEHFADRLLSRRFDIPEAGHDVPDFLDEIRFNVEWMRKMQHEDGAVAHKLDSHGFADFVMPTSDIQQQYFSDWGSAATADFVAVMARAARTYEPFDVDFASACVSAAQLSFDFVLKNPAKEPDLSNFAEDQYRTGAADDVCWAACEMWETTGEQKALQECEARVDASRLADNWDWSDTSNLCLITYAMSSRDDADRRDPELVESAIDAIVASADRLAANAEENPYGLGYVENRYWGINGVFARSVVNLQTAYRIDPKPEYLDAATQQIDHLLGSNHYGRSQVTGIGHRPPLYPHHRPSSADNVADPWPGLLVGGANLSREERDQEGALAAGITWEDSLQSYQTNEVAINWNAAIIYAVAGFVQ